MRADEKLSNYSNVAGIANSSPKRRCKDRRKSGQRIFQSRIRVARIATNCATSRRARSACKLLSPERTRVVRPMLARESRPAKAKKRVLIDLKRQKSANCGQRLFAKRIALAKFVGSSAKRGSVKHCASRQASPYAGHTALQQSIATKQRSAN